MLIWLVVIGLFVWVVVRLLSGSRSADRYWTPPARPDDPEEILRARFARGEIGPDEFEQRLEVLRRTRPPQAPPPK
jgi:putative membrane protein